MKTETRQGISIVLPCYNPLPGWWQTLQEAICELERKLPGTPIEYIVSNDGSANLSLMNIPSLNGIPNLMLLDSVINEGKGSAIRKGAAMARGEIIVYTDIDFPFGTDPIVEMVRIFHDNPHCAFVYGNRGKDYFEMLPLKRRLVSKVLQVLNRFFLGKNITDSQAGIKGFRREILPQLLATRTNTFIFEIELILSLLQKGVKIHGLDVSVKPSVIFTDFSLKVLLREAASFMKIIIPIRLCKPHS
ncbi:glycosyltransferase [Dyadobacter sp. 32]|uniref:glycosyltransferase n=1 Tax=Dyadobacter sp. 32 TaxID=538966 RepID=UPI0011EB9FAE